MGADGIIAIVSSVCGVATAAISAPWSGRRWQRVVGDELSLYSTMRRSADSPREVAVATLLRQDAFGRALRGLGYRMSDGVPVKVDWSVARSGALAFCGTFAVDAFLTMVEYGDVLGRIETVLGAALLSTALYVAPFLIGPRWPRTERNPLYARAVAKRIADESDWRLLLVDSELTMIGDELSSIEERCTGSAPAPADMARIRSVRKRISELRREVAAEEHAPASPEQRSEQGVHEAVHGHVDDDGAQGV